MADLFERIQSALADRYVVEREIGRGGMATVYLAEDLRHERKVAIKVLHPELAATLGTDRFLREIKIAAGLNHPHILPLFDSGEAEGFLYYVMPFVQGESLRDRLEREGPQPIDGALKIAGEVADGLDYAHRQGVVHRDIKPGNILLSEGHALIADFGVARAVGAASSGDATATGLAVGTPKYMSPEQAAGGEVDGRSDVYALGCVLWEMFVGEPPFDGPTPAAILARKTVEEAPEVRGVRKTVPSQQENVLAKALATIPVDRFQTAGEMAAALDSPELVKRRRPDPGILKRIVDVGVAVILLAVGVWLTRMFAVGGGAEDQPEAAGPQRMPETVDAPAFSPDGTRLAYCAFVEGARHVLITEIANWEAARRIAVADHCTKLEWMPDGSGVVFSGQVRGQAGIFTASAEGRTADRLDLPIVDEFALSPDGERMVTIGPNADTLYVGPLGAPLQEFDRILDTGEYQWFMFVDWSPGSDRIAVVVARSAQEFEIVTMLSDGSQQKTVLGPLYWIPQYLTWSPDGRALYFHAYQGGDLFRLAISEDGAAEGEREVLASSGDAVRWDIAVSPDGRSLFYHDEVTSRRILHVAPGPAPGASAAITTPVFDDVGGFAVSKDGEWLAFGRSGEVYTAPVARGTAERVTAAGNVGAFDWSPDGRFLAYESEWQDTARVWLTSAAGIGETGMVNGTAMTGKLAWEGGRLLYAAPDLREFHVLEDLELWSYETRGWQSLADVDVDAVDWARGARASSRTLPAIDSIGSAWPDRPLLAPDGSRVLIQWALDATSLHWWLVDIESSSRVYMPSRGEELLGWTEDGTGLYWMVGRGIQSQDLESGAMKEVLTLPDTLNVLGCRRRRASDGIEFYCIEQTREFIPYLFEDFDPHVEVPAEDDNT